MNLSRQIAVGSLAWFVAVARVGSAQSTEGTHSDPHRWAVAIALDGGTVPDELSVRCGNGGSRPAVGGGLAALFRPRSWFVVEGDTRVSVVPPVGCGDLVPAPGPNEFYAGREYPGPAPGPILLRSALRVGVESPDGWPLLLRATVGSGVMWIDRPLLFETSAIAASSRYHGARLYVELEGNVSRLRVRELYDRVTADSVLGSVRTIRSESHILRPTWTTLHIGLEFPMARAH